MRTKKLIKIYNKLSQLAQKGVDAYSEYSSYINDCIDNGEYSLLDDVFVKYYNTNIHIYNTISELKQKTWDIILFNSSGNYQVNLKSYYDAKNVYQVGQTIYDATTNDILGTFIEIPLMNVTNYKGVSYSSYPSHIYYRNPSLFYKLDQAKEIGLQVISNYDITLNVILSDPNMSMLDKHKLGISILITK